MTCTTADRLHLRESSSVEALQKLVVKSRGAWMISDVSRINEEQRISAEQMKTTIRPKPPIIHQHTASRQITSHLCSRDHRRCTLRFTSCPLLPRLLPQKSIPWKTESRETASIIHRLLRHLLESLNVQRERWRSMKTMMTMEKRIRKAALFLHRDLGQDLLQEKRRLHLRVG
jgi:hypothetical protein